MNSAQSTATASVYIAESFLAVDLPNFDNCTTAAREGAFKVLGIDFASDPQPRTVRSTLTGKCKHKTHTHNPNADFNRERFTCAGCGIWFERYTW